ncbi:MAG: hypothetical protein ACYCRM_04880 [Candidatus Dormibacteria bacterium]
MDASLVVDWVALAAASNFAGFGEQPHTVAEDQVIIGHGGPSLEL